MSDPFVGQIIQVGFNFAPRGWSLCNGATLPIAQNAALFSLLGTQFGGNGTTTFQLPDLQSRVGIGAGHGAGLSPYVAGQFGGVESTVLTQANLPAHTHSATFANNNSTFNVANVRPTENFPVAQGAIGRSFDGNVPQTSLPWIYCPAGTAANIPQAGLNVAGTVTVNSTGGNTPTTIVQPYLALTTVIALQGLFPSRS